MTNNDYIDLLKHLRRLVRTSLFDSLDSIASTESDLIDSAFDRFTNYLEIVIHQLKTLSGENVNRTTTRLNNVLKIANDEPFEGVEVELTSNQAEQYGRDRFSLGQKNNYRKAISELENLMTVAQNNKPTPPTNTPQFGGGR